MADLDRLTELFRRAGEAHHRAFAETDGDDPEWPLWYARHLVPDLRVLLAPDLTVSEVVHRIMEAEERRAAESPEAQWAEYYARTFAGRYG